MTEIIVRGDSEVFAVDDDPIFQEILEFTYSLSNIPNTLTQVYSGFDCIDALNDLLKAGKSLPALILMDINMPGMSGIQTVAKIRENPAFAQIPIITMLSSSNEQRDIDRSLNAGATAYYEKPFDITQLKFVHEAA